MNDLGLTEQFSLRWNNFHTNLSTEFHTLLQEEDLVDVTIAADGKYVQAHKIVLSVCSPYFKKLFKINPCKHPIVILQDVTYTALGGLLQFMYCGEVSVCQEELADFLKTAELLQVKGLTGSDTQEPTRALNKRPVTPETKRKCKVPRRIPTEERDHHDRERADSASPVSLVNSTTTTSISSLPATASDPEKHSAVADYCESDEMEDQKPILPLAFAATTLLPINASGDSSTNSFHQQQTNPGIKAAPCPTFTNSQEHDGTQVGFRTTSRGRLQLVHYGYVYHCNRQKEDKIFWKCAEYNKTGCRGRCITVGESITVTHPFHNHMVRQEAVSSTEKEAAVDANPFWDSEMITELNMAKSLSATVGNCLDKAALKNTV